MKVLSLFSGIGAFEKALTNIGVDYEVVGFSEIDKYAIESYSAIHDVDKSLNLGDISSIKTEDMPDCDMVTYGFPCQDISVAGNLKGIIEGETRSGLLFEALRVIRDKKPSYAIAENVKNLVGKKFKEDFEGLLAELESYGYNNYWQVLNAKDYGIPQNRERVFVVSIRKDVDDGKFEFPKSYDSGLRLKDLLEDEVEDKYYIENDRTSVLLNNLKEQDLLNGERFGADSTINDTKKREISNCIIARYDAGIVNQKQSGLVVVEPKICQKVGDRGTNNYSVKDISNTIPANPMSDRGQLLLEPSNELKLFTNLKGGKWDKIHESARRVYDEEGIAPTIPTCGGGNIEPKVQTNYRIRKLTPKECWRLMGFTDEDYHKARQALEDRFYNGKDRSKSQMYKMAGNSIVVNVLESILKSLIR